MVLTTFEESVAKVSSAVVRRQKSAAVARNDCRLLPLSAATATDTATAAVAPLLPLPPLPLPPQQLPPPPSVIRKSREGGEP